MRSKYPRMTAAIAAAFIGIAVLAGCSSNSTDAADKPPTFSCDEATSAAVKTAEEEKNDAKATLADAAAFDKKEAEATLATATLKYEAIDARATECATEDEEKADAEAAAALDAEACGDARFEQVFIDRAATAKVDPRYEGEVRPIITNAGLNDQQKMDAIIDVELKLAASNAQTLAFWAYGAGLYEDPNDWPELVEGGKIEGGECLTDKGKMLWSKYEGAITAKGVTLAVGEANPNSTNTGINGNTAVVDIQTGISGDMMTIVITFADGSQMKKMVRCGNLELPGVPPGIPPGKTDNPEKNPQESSSQNPANPGHIVRDNGEHQVNWNNGNTDPRGYQPSAADVRAAQEAAARAAAEEQARRDAEHKAAQEAAKTDGAGVVETSTEDLGESSTPGTDW